MGSRTIESKEIGKFNIDNDLVYVVNQGDFGYTSDDDTISVATTQDVGGIKLYTSDEAKSGVIDDNALTYAVQIYSAENPKAFVHVPWINSQYLVRLTIEDPDGQDIVLCVDNDSIHKVGDTMMSSLGWLELDHVHADKVKYAGDLFRKNEYDVSCRIAEPLSNEISTNVAALNTEIQNLDKKYEAKIQSLSTEVNSICADLSNSIIELSQNLCTDIEDKELSIYTRIDTLCCTQDIAPSWFKDRTYRNDQVDDLLSQLSNTVTGKFMEKYESYLCAETSSKQELQDMFDTKQNNLSIRTSVTKDYSTELDVPTVKAVQDFVNSSMLTNTATFRGSYGSLKEVPTDGTRYIGGKPDLNDYMFVDITDDTTGAWRESLKTLEKGTWRFKYVPKTWDEGGIGGWYEEYLINDAMFTDALKKAIDSGITSYLVSLIMSYATIKAKLTAECPNMVAKLGSLAYLDGITNNITGKGTAGKLAVFDGTNSIKSNNSITPRQETWEFTLVDGSKVTKKIVVSD